MTNTRFKKGHIPKHKNPYPPIPSLCLCGCNEIVWNRHRWISGHDKKGNKNWGQSKRMKGNKIHLGFKHTDEQKQIWSKERKGIRKSPKTEFKKGIKPWCYEKEHHKIKGDLNPAKRSEVRKKISEKLIGNKNGVGERSEDFKERYRGSNHPNWMGGISFLPYCSRFNKSLKESVRIRDNHTCQLCSTLQNGHKLSIHHIHYDKQNCYPDLIALCIKCNSKVNFHREHYEKLFMNKLNDRELLFWTRRIIE